MHGKSLRHGILFNLCAQCYEPMWCMDNIKVISNRTVKGRQTTVEAGSVL